MVADDNGASTRLTAKTLRFYHEVALLKPARVDPVNNYRLDDVEQISAAQVIRQFRALDMPVDLIRDVPCCRRRRAERADRWASGADGG